MADYDNGIPPEGTGVEGYEGYVGSSKTTRNTQNLKNLNNNNGVGSNKLIRSDNDVTTEIISTNFETIGASKFQRSVVEMDDVKRDNSILGTSFILKDSPDTGILIITYPF